MHFFAIFLFFNLSFIHCVKSVQIRSFSSPYFLAYGLTTRTLCIQSECGKIRTRKNSVFWFCCCLISRDHQKIIKRNTMNDCKFYFTFHSRNVATYVQSRNIWKDPIVPLSTFLWAAWGFSFNLTFFNFVA